MNAKYHIRTTATVLGAAFCLAVTMAACAAPGGDTAASPEGPTPPAPQPTAASSAPTGRPGQVEAAVLADRVGEYLRQTYPDQYAGISIDGAKLIVYRVPSTTLDGALRTKFPTAPVELRDAAHSARRLEALAQRITDDIDYWTRKGVPITTVAARFDGSAVEIGTTDLQKATAELPERYGPAPLEFTEASPALPLPNATPS
ncbi:hypothetical protein [Sphaerisporangium aureirubrum]|uniref:Uncharacterized protein n=1 Tax=Sphaerisporangium aureirubrum TaxID=1544736 RepID=A0ABW1NH49_9ACTN